MSNLPYSECLEDGDALTLPVPECGACGYDYGPVPRSVWGDVQGLVFTCPKCESKTGYANPYRGDDECSD